MKVTKIEATPLETITVAGEEVRVEGTGVETYEVEIDWKKEISTKWHFERSIEYREEQKASFVAKCDEEIAKYKAILANVEKVDAKVLSDNITKEWLEK